MSVKDFMPYIFRVSVHLHKVLSGFSTSLEFCIISYKRGMVTSSYPLFFSLHYYHLP